jgi:hypothetical protein
VETRRERPGVRLSVIVADRPTARAAHRIPRRDRDPRDVGESGEHQLLVANDERTQNHRPNEPAPEHESRAAEQITRVVSDDRVVVDLSADERADERAEEHVAHGGRLDVALPTRQLAFRHDLRDEKRQKHGEPEAGETQRADVEGERMMDDRGREHYAATRPGMG